MVDPQQFAAAVWEEDVGAVEAMIAAGADVNAPSEEHYFLPLGLAIEQGSVDIVRRLIAAGVDVNLVQEDDFTPLAHAIDLESDSVFQRQEPIETVSTEITELLLAAGAVPTEKAFEVARNYGNLKALTLLQEYSGVDCPGTEVSEPDPAHGSAVASG